VKQPSPSSPFVIDIRGEQFNELTQSSKETLENQDSVAQQLDKHHSGIGEVCSEDKINIACSLFIL